MLVSHLRHHFGHRVEERMARGALRSQTIGMPRAELTLLAAHLNASAVLVVAVEIQVSQ